MRRRKISVWLVVFAVLLGTGFVIFQADRRLLPVALALATSQTQKKVGLMVDQAVTDAVDELGLSAEDLFLKAPTGQDNAFAVDAMAVNQLCATVSRRLNQDLLGLSAETVDIPLGAVMGVALWANTGPSISFVLRPVGTVAVDYTTSFQAVGINQTNFQISLHTTVTVGLANPLVGQNVTLERKLVLLDTVISGQVPDKYFELNP